MWARSSNRDLELRRRYCVIRTVRRVYSDPGLARAGLLISLWRGASQRVLPGHWPANVVRSAYRENACSCCVEGTCCEAGRKGPLP